MIGVLATTSAAPRNGVAGERRHRGQRRRDCGPRVVDDGEVSVLAGAVGPTASRPHGPTVRRSTTAAASPALVISPTTKVEAPSPESSGPETEGMPC